MLQWENDDHYMMYKILTYSGRHMPSNRLYHFTSILEYY